MFVWPLDGRAAVAAAGGRVTLATARGTPAATLIVVLDVAAVIAPSREARRTQWTEPGAARLSANADAAEVEPLDRTLNYTAHTGGGN